MGISQAGCEISRDQLLGFYQSDWQLFSLYFIENKCLDISVSD